MAQEGKEQQYFVRVTYEWGKQNGESQKAETVGGSTWGYLNYDQSVACDYIVGEAMKKLIDDAVGLGLELVSDQTMVDKIRSK